MKRLLLTGVTGFIGAHCLRLIRNGDYDEIHAVGRHERAPRPFMDIASWLSGMPSRAWRSISRCRLRGAAIGWEIEQFKDDIVQRLKPSLLQGADN